MDSPLDGTQVAALLGAAGYPTPPTVEDAVRLLLGEIEAAKRVAERCYRDGYDIGRQGYIAGRRAVTSSAAACPLCYPNGVPS